MTLSEHISRSELISGKEDKAKELNRKEFYFVDVAIGGVDRRNNIQNVREVRKRIKEDVECFCTWHRYPSELLEYFESNEKKVGGYNGPSYADSLPFDFDREEDPGLAHESAKDFATSLKNNFEVPLDSLEYFFSGRKGFLPSVCLYFRSSQNLQKY